MAPVGAGSAVPHPGNGPDDDPALDRLPRHGREFVEGAGDHYRGGDAFGRRAHAASQRKDRQVILRRCDQRRPRPAADPVGNHDLLQVDPVQFFLPHAVRCPLDSAFEPGGPAQPVADTEGEVLQLRPAVHVGERRPENLPGGLAVAVREFMPVAGMRRPLRRLGVGGARAEERRGEQEGIAPHGRRIIGDDSPAAAARVLSGSPREQQYPGGEDGLIGLGRPL